METAAEVGEDAREGTLTSNPSSLHSRPSFSGVGVGGQLLEKHNGFPGG